MKQRIFNLIILDESGSMQCIKSAAVSGVNETIQTIRAAQREHEEQVHYVSLVAFNSSEIRKIYDVAPIGKAKEISSRQFVPEACTPLYDAMGKSLTALRKKVAEVDRVLVTIITDGMENSSTEYSGPAIKALVDELKGKGWVFVYIGANQDVESVAASLSIHNTLQFEYTASGTQAMMAKTNVRRRKFYDRMSEDSFDGEKENCSFFKED